VRNLADGTVETVFKGPENVVDRMLLWLRSGSPTAKVIAVESQEGQLASGCLDFVIR